MNFDDIFLVKFDFSHFVLGVPVFIFGADEERTFLIFSIEQIKLEAKHASNY